MYNVVFLDRNAKDDRNFTLCFIVLIDPQISPVAFISVIIKSYG